jgi:protein-disulfide isomerase
MKKIIKNSFFILLLFLLPYCDQSLESKNTSNVSNNIVTVKVFSSLTCPHCADFHNKIFENLNKEFINLGKVKFEHHSFPLDLAALNAEKLLHCNDRNEINFQFLGEIYKKQNEWAVGSDINKINSSLKNLSGKFGLSNAQMIKCLEDKNLEEYILNQRVQSQKNYKISSTPTIYINDKVYKGKIDYQSFKKVIEKYQK